MKLKVDFAKSAEPTLKMVRCISWIAETLQIPVAETVWYDFGQASKFIDENIKECIDYYAINAIDRKYQHLQPKWKYYLDD